MAVEAMANVSIDEKYSTAGYFGEVQEEIDIPGVLRDAALEESPVKSQEEVQKVSMAGLQNDRDAGSTPQDVPYGYW